MVVMIGGVVGAPIWLFISAKTSKFKAWIIFNVAGNALNLLLLFPKPGQTYLTLVSWRAAGLSGLTNITIALTPKRFPIRSLHFCSGSHMEGTF